MRPLYAPIRECVWTDVISVHVMYFNIIFSLSHFLSPKKAISKSGSKQNLSGGHALSQSYITIVVNILMSEDLL